MNQERIIDTAARREGFLSRIRGRLPMPGLPRPFAPPARRSGLETLDGLEGHFAVIGASLEEPDEQTLRTQLEPAVDSLVRNGVIGDNTVVEARPMIPEDALRPKLANTVLQAIGIVKEEVEELEERDMAEDISVVQNSSAITPVRHAGSSADPEKVWSEVGTAYDHLDRQIHTGSSSRHTETLLLALTQPNYARQIFGNRLVFGTEPLEIHQPMVLTRLGSESRDLVLAPPFPGMR